MEQITTKNKPLVEGMYTIHRDYKYGKPKLAPQEKQRLQAEQSRRCASKREARRNGQLCISGRAR